MINTIQDPVSLYIHMPWCLKKCPYCDFNSHAISSRDIIPEETYIDALYTDFMEQKKYFSNRRIKSIFFGGGTPSLFSAKVIKNLIHLIRNEVDFVDNIEISLEANPGAIDHQQFEQYYISGINRLSLGIQSFNNKYLCSLGRIHSKDDIYTAIELIKKCGFNSFNFDIMYGLPNQSIEDAINDLHSALQFDPFHLSWYQLTIEPNTIFYSKPPTIPKEGIIADIEKSGLDLLNKHGLKRYEVSSYCKPTHECIHNINYWIYGDYIGIGAGAHSKITFDNDILRIRKVNQPNTYLSSKSKIGSQTTVNQDDRLFEFMLNNLRLTKNISLSLLKKQTGLSIEKFEHKFELAIKRGLLNIDPSTIIVTDLGRKYLNDLTEIFLP